MTSVEQPDPTGVVSIEVLQSQLFLLKVLAAAMAKRWQPDVRPSSRASSRRTLTSELDPVAQRPSSHSSTPIPWTEAPPLEEACAKYVLSVMIPYLRQTATSEPPLIMTSSRFADVAFRDYDPEVIKAKSANHISDRAPHVLHHSLRNRPSSNSVNSAGKESTSSYVLLSGNDAVYEKTHTSSIDSSHTLSQLILKFAGRIIFHISASNWKVVFQRLRLRIHFLATHTDESSDCTDLSVLGHSVLDRPRLLQIMNGA